MFGNDKLLRAIRLVDNIKIEIYQQGNRRKYGLIWTSVLTENNKNSSATPYDADFAPPIKTKKFDIADSDETVIDEAIRLYIIKNGQGHLQSQRSYYKVVQDPFKDPFAGRTYGSTKSPYYLNNGCSLTIEWIGSIPNPAFELGTYSTIEDADDYNDLKGIDRYLRNQNITSKNDDDGSSIKSKWVIPTGVVDASLRPIPDYRDSSYIQEKRVKITLPKDVTEKDKYLIWSDKSELDYENSSKPKNTYFSSSSDKDVVKLVISKFKSQVAKLHGISISDYDLKLCEPDTESCSIIPYKSPVQPPNNTPAQVIENEKPASATQSTPKVKLTIDGLPEVIEIKAKTNLNTFTIWTGPIPKSPSLIDNYEDTDELDPEYLEDGYKGFEETAIDFKTWKIQGEIANSQQDSNSNMGTVGSPANIKPYSSFDQLIDLAGQCARELGKNPRVNANNMKMGYTNGIHGLCPQGTQAVLYALTGIKSLGQISGNADWFSFKSPTIPAGGDYKGDFSKTGYFESKVKISQVNGSWKGTYLTDKNQWQIGDVIAMGYVNKSYGHIQVWTGFSWMSDFKQGNAIQQNHVDPNSVALWRLNQKGVDAVKKQSGRVA